MWQTYYLVARDLMAQREAEAAADRLAHVAASTRPQRRVPGARHTAARLVAGFSRGTAGLARRLDDGSVVDALDEAPCA